MKHFYLKSLPTLLLLAWLAGSSLPAWAQQIQGAELTYTLDPANLLKMRAQLTAYTDFSHTVPDNPEVHIQVGPDQWVRVERTRRSRLPDGYYKSVYQFDHVFPAPGTYPISFGWQNRDVGMVNFTDSGNQAFWITTEVMVDTEGTANQQSPQFLTNPVQVVPLGQTVRHHIGAFEPEGDSLAFQLGIQPAGPQHPRHRLCVAGLCQA